MSDELTRGQLVKKALVNFFWGGLLIAIGVFGGSSVFGGQAGWLDYFFDGLGVFWILLGIYQLIRSRSAPEA